jgi:glycine betaine/proline transport system ATP-binding protein
MQDELLELQSNDKRTIVFISHDLDEAIRIGDRIAIMQNGEISQIGTPEDIINNPANDYIRSFFKGVDVTSVLTAGHIAKKLRPTIIDKESTGVKSALQYIGDFDEDYAYFVEKSGKYLGILTLDSLKEQKQKGGTIYDAIYCNKAVTDDTQISDFITDVAEYQYPLPVIDGKGKYKGTISKSRLLKVFDEGLEEGESHE